MAIKGLLIIGEAINDSIPSTRKLYDAGDMGGILGLARMQDEGGADYIDVNVGRRPPSQMADVVRRVQDVTSKPLSIDTPDAELAKAGLGAYDPARAGGKAPVLNSISPMRKEMLGLLGIRRFMPVLLVSERAEGGGFKPNRTAEDTFATAREMLTAARRSGLGNEQCIIDPGIAPIGGDLEGNLKRLLGALRMIRDDSEFGGVHVSVGLSNFTHMLPAKRAGGSPVRSALESAFLTLAMPFGLDMVIGSVKRKYELLPPDHPAMACIRDVLSLEGYDAVERVMEFYN